MTTAQRTHAADEFVHPALFYRGTGEYLNGIVSFIRAGLAAGEPVAVAVPAPKLRLIATELGIDADRVRLLDMARAGRNPGRIIPGVLFAFVDAHPGQRARIVGEPIWPGRTSVEYPACVQHEALINPAFAGRGVTILCPYDAAALAPQTLADAEATHPLLIDAEGSRTSPAYDPDRILAEYNRPLPPVAAPTVTFDVTTLGAVRRAARENATQLGLTGDYTELDLLVGELTANSVAHGGGGGSLGIWVEGDQLVCEVRDAGHITDALAGRRPVTAQQAAGRGLLLVNHLADLVRMHTGPDGTTIRLYLTMRGRRGDGSGDAAAVGQQVAHRVSPNPVSLRWQTHDALRAAARFSRYLRTEQGGSDPEEAGVPGGRSRPRSALDALAASETLSGCIDQWRNRLVQLARRRGAPWNEIGNALGVTKQAAHERYGEARRRSSEPPKFEAPKFESPGAGAPKD